jgi:hypothetical protein
MTTRPTEPTPFTLVRIEASTPQGQGVDTHADGTVLRIIASLTEPVDVPDLFRIAPVDAGVPSVFPRGLRYAFIRAALARPDDGSELAGFHVEARAAVDAVKASAPTSPLERFLATHAGATDPAKLMAFDVARWLGVAPAEAASMAGLSEPPSVVMLAPCAEARRLTDVRARAAEEAARLEAQRTREQKAAVAPRSLDAMGCDALELVTTSTSSPPRILDGELLHWRQDGRKFVVWQRVPGFSLPPLALETVRVCQGSELFPFDWPTVAPMSGPVFAFARGLRAAHAQVDEGPVTSFSTAGLDLARELLEKHGRTLYACIPAHRFHRGLLAELLVRGLLLPCDVAADLMSAEVERRHGPAPTVALPSDRFTGQIRAVANRFNAPSEELHVLAHPLPTSTMTRVEIEGAVVAAAHAGCISPGCLLPASASSLPLPKQSNPSPKKAAPRTAA